MFQPNHLNILDLKALKDLRLTTQHGGMHRKSITVGQLHPNLQAMRKKRSSLSLPLSLSVSLCLSLPLSVSLSFFISASLYLFLPSYISLSLSLSWYFFLFPHFIYRCSSCNILCGAVGSKKWLCQEDY